MVHGMADEMSLTIDSTEYIHYTLQLHSMECLRVPGRTNKYNFCRSSLIQC